MQGTAAAVPSAEVYSQGTKLEDEKTYLLKVSKGHLEDTALEAV